MNSITAQICYTKIDKKAKRKIGFGYSGKYIGQVISLFSENFEYCIQLKQVMTRPIYMYLCLGYAECFASDVLFE